MIYICNYCNQILEYDTSSYESDSKRFIDYKCDNHKYKIVYSIENMTPGDVNTVELYRFAIKIDAETSFLVYDYDVRVPPRLFYKNGKTILTIPLLLEILFSSPNNIGDRCLKILELKAFL